jgi:hypothetical protein
MEGGYREDETFILGHLIERTDFGPSASPADWARATRMV